MSIIGEKDILESTNNKPYLRFFSSKSNIEYELSSLVILIYSCYYNVDNKDELLKQNGNPFASFIPEGLFNQDKV